MLFFQGGRMDEVLKESKSIANDLMTKKPVKCSELELPKTGGVYLIYFLKNSMYVGKATNLHRRIKSDHVSGAKDTETSSFRTSLQSNRGITPGKDMKEWIIKNCFFSYVPIEDRDMCALVEAILIRHFRAKKDMYNK